MANAIDGVCGGYLAVYFISGEPLIVFFDYLCFYDNSQRSYPLNKHHNSGFWS